MFTVLVYFSKFLLAHFHHLEFSSFNGLSNSFKFFLFPKQSKFNIKKEIFREDMGCFLTKIPEKFLGKMQGSLFRALS